ncbi:MAG: MoaD/ThiS family protein [Chloroflexi bacterium]|nr:MoaD/ThiS family protein [Chloroflexota bacterium]
MPLRIRLHGNLRKYLGGRQEPISLDVAVSFPLRYILSQLGVPEGEVWTFSVNGGLADATTEVVSGDEIDLFGPVAGGSLNPAQ